MMHCCERCGEPEGFGCICHEPPKGIVAKAGVWTCTQCGHERVPQMVSMAGGYSCACPMCGYSGFTTLLNLDATTDALTELGQFRAELSRIRGLLAEQNLFVFLHNALLNEPRIESGDEGVIAERLADKLRTYLLPQLAEKEKP